MRSKDKKLRILFVYSHLSTFVEKDLKLLKTQFQVTNYCYKIERMAGKRLIKWLIQHRHEYDLIFIWFGDIYATISVLMSKILRKRTIIVVGGYDVTYIPELDYGLLSTPKKRLYAKIAYSLANKVIVVDDSLREKIITNTGVHGRNIVTIPTAYNYNLWKPCGEKENFVLTVCAINEINRIKLKGIDTFIEAARHLPETNFLVIGVNDAFHHILQNNLPENVKLMGFVPHEKLLTYYQKAKVYCQLSMSEGLPNALCEAMLCECVPVGTKAGGIPTAIGDTGFYVSYGDVEATATAIKDAFKSGTGNAVRERIKTLFPEERREKELIEVIENLIGD